MSHFVPATAPEAPAVRSAEALPPDAKTQVQQVLDQYHASPQYHTARIPTAPASDPLQWACW